jgi:transposase
MYRRYRGAGAPESSRCAAEQTDTLSLRFNRNDKDNDKQALGRSRGGFTSKIVGVCDAAGRLVDFVLVAGQAHELAPSLQLLKRLPSAPAWASEHAREGLADMACDAAEFRSAAEAMGATPVVPSRKNAKQKKPCPGFIYRHRNLIERCWSRLKEWRAIATRYDKTATSYAAGIAIAATLDWFKSSR